MSKESLTIFIGFTLQRIVFRSCLEVQSELCIHTSYFITMPILKIIANLLYPFQLIKSVNLLYSFPLYIWTDANTSGKSTFILSSRFSWLFLFRFLNNGLNLLAQILKILSLTTKTAIPSRNYISTCRQIIEEKNQNRNV